ncbi:hypothetical protein [Paenibacillus sp. L3-i20]|uniref:hypothetical protein n=1 Tax=Paenibacillus sp. L3-i20 TaxID=2905833 RepID=UPI001EDCF4C0|nr:hypothetical protein [Paenibacillus sp. L3-i20]GKU75877.1 hypothetical protein L3i20_v202740 [Paenibacillus sp. L3-i20]
MLDMETIMLKGIRINYQAKTMQPVQFHKADLVFVTQYGDRLWYIDLEGVNDRHLLAWFGQSEDIAVVVRADSIDGDVWEGMGYFHPNEPNNAAAIRGAGELYKL